MAQITDATGGFSYNTNNKAGSTKLPGTSSRGSTTHVSGSGAVHGGLGGSYGTPVSSATPYAGFSSNLNTGASRGYYGGGGGGGYDMGGIDYSAWFDMLKNIVDSKYNSLADAIKSARKRSDDEIRKNYMANRRQWQRMYGRNNPNGQGLSNLWNLQSNRDDNLQKSAENELNTLAQANATRFGDYMNLTSMLANMNGDTIQKIMSSL